MVMKQINQTNTYGDIFDAFSAEHGRSNNISELMRIHAKWRRLGKLAKNGRL